MRYQYSNNVVYNNFPWPAVTANKMDAIAQTADGILEARKNIILNDATCTLDDMYDSSAMPDSLREAHIRNDKAVMKAYGFPQSMTESEIVAELMKLYQQLVDAEQKSK